MRCRLAGAAGNRWTRARGRDELGTDMSQRVLPATLLLSISVNHPLSRKKLNGFCSPISTTRVGLGVWCCTATSLRDDGNYRVRHRRCRHCHSRGNAMKPRRLLSSLSFTRRSFPTGIRDGRREPGEPRPCSLGPRNVDSDLAAVGISPQVQESPVRGSKEPARSPKALSCWSISAEKTASRSRIRKR